MGKKIFLACILFAIYGCGSDKKQEPLATCFGFQAAQVVVSVSNAFGGAAIKNAQVKVNQHGSSLSGTFEAAYVEDASGIGSYVSFENINERDYKIDISVAAEGFQTYQSKTVSFSLKTACASDNTTQFTVNLCPTGAVCD